MASLTSPLASFNGTSRFASSLQQVLTRAIGIAALPLHSLDARQTTLNDRLSGLQKLDVRFSSLQASLGAIQRMVGSGVLSSSVSNGSVISAAIESGAGAGVYSIEVEDLGSSSSALSVAGTTPVTDPGQQGLNTATSFSLNAGGSTFSITSQSSSLQDVASAINLQAGTQVQASIVNVGSSASPDYRLSLRATKLGAAAITLTDDSAGNLISGSTAGALARYKVEGSSSVTSDSRTVTLAPGVTATLLAKSAVGEPATVAVRTDAAGLASAFSQFAQAYNAAVEGINESHGQNGGALQGDSLLNTLSGILRQLGSYSQGTPETALANYGITLDKSGHLSVDSAALAARANTGFPAFLALVGKSDTSGFLKLATDLLDSVEHTETGYLTNAENAVNTQSTALQNKIAEREQRLLQLQQNLVMQLAKADTAIARLESRVSYVNGLFYSITGNNNRGTNEQP